MHPLHQLHFSQISQASMEMALPLALGQGHSALFDPWLTQRRNDEADGQRQEESPAGIHPSPLTSWGNELHLSAVVVMAQATPHAPYRAVHGHPGKL